MRLDLYVASQKNITRTRAANIIRSGGVTINGKSCTKAGAETDGSGVLINDTVKYASLGGVKLENALNTFNLSVKGKICLDVGAANGGFTDCLVRQGAACVHAVDLHVEFPAWLADNQNVVIHDGVNAKFLEQEFGTSVFDLVVADLSFIPLESVMQQIAIVSKKGGNVILLFKPQFEVGRAALPKSGVVNNGKAISKAFDAVIEKAKACGLTYVGTCDVPEMFSDKNKEKTILFQY